MFSDALFLDRETRIEEINENDVLSIAEGTSQSFNLECPMEGLTFNACGEEGNVTVYVSTSVSQPNSGFYNRAMTIDAGQCQDTFVDCAASEGRRSRRQTFTMYSRCYVTIEGRGQGENQCRVGVKRGDSSTKRGMCAVYREQIF